MPGSCRNIHDPGKHKIGRLEMSKKKENKNALHGFLLVMPWFVGFLIFYLYPICSNIGLSFTDKTIWGEGKFIGLKNYYKIFFEDKVFWICLKNTFLWVIFSNVIMLSVSLIIANLLAGKVKGGKFFRTVFYFPCLLPPVAFGVVLGFIFSGSPNGFVNHLFGLGTHGWFSDSTLAMPTAIVSSIWYIGTPMIIFLAAIKGINPSYQEAALIDGAGAVRRFFSVTLPLISQSIIFNFIMGIINGWQVYEHIIPFTKAEGDVIKPYGRDYGLGVLLIHIYEKGFKDFEIAYAAALGIILLIIVLLCTLAGFGLIKKLKLDYQSFD
jgi:sugar ABC transporter permease